MSIIQEASSLLEPTFIGPWCCESLFWQFRKKPEHFSTPIKKACGVDAATHLTSIKYKHTWPIKLILIRLSRYFLFYRTQMSRHMSCSRDLRHPSGLHKISLWCSETSNADTHTCKGCLTTLGHHHRWLTNMTSVKQQAVMRNSVRRAEADDEWMWAWVWKRKSQNKENHHVSCIINQQKRTRKTG